MDLRQILEGLLSKKKKRNRYIARSWYRTYTVRIPAIVLRYAPLQKKNMDKHEKKHK